MISQVDRTFPRLKATFVDFWSDVVVSQTELRLHTGRFIFGHDLRTNVIQFTASHPEVSVLSIFEYRSLVRDLGRKRGKLTQ